jgi:hypothetical protein
MLGFNFLGKTLFLVGILFMILGGIFLLAERFPLLFRLPGDILIQRKNFIFYFPFGLCVLLSIILTVILRIFRH